MARDGAHLRETAKKMDARLAHVTVGFYGGDARAREPKHAG